MPKSLVRLTSCVCLFGLACVAQVRPAASGAMLKHAMGQIDADVSAERFAKAYCQIMSTRRDYSLSESQRGEFVLRAAEVAFLMKRHELAAPDLEEFVRIESGKTSARSSVLNDAKAQLAYCYLKMGFLARAKGLCEDIIKGPKGVLNYEVLYRRVVRDYAAAKGKLRAELAKPVDKWRVQVWERLILSLQVGEVDGAVELAVAWRVLCGGGGDRVCGEAAISLYEGDYVVAAAQFGEAVDLPWREWVVWSMALEGRWDDVSRLTSRPVTDRLKQFGAMAALAEGDLQKYLELCGDGRAGRK